MNLYHRSFATYERTYIRLLLIFSISPGPRFDHWNSNSCFQLIPWIRSLLIMDKLLVDMDFKAWSSRAEITKSRTVKLRVHHMSKARLRIGRDTSSTEHTAIFSAEPSYKD